MKILLVFAAVVAVVVVVSFVLGGVDIPAPSAEIHKTIPPDRLPH